MADLMTGRAWRRHLQVPQEAGSHAHDGRPGHARGAGGQGQVSAHLPDCEIVLASKDR